jgi:hypothetical protein
VPGQWLYLDSLPSKLDEDRVDRIPGWKVKTRGTDQDLLEAGLASLIRRSLYVACEVLELSDEPLMGVLERGGRSQVVKVGRGVVDRLGGFVHPGEKLLERLGLAQPPETEVDAVTGVAYCRGVVRLRGRFSVTAECEPHDPDGDHRRDDNSRNNQPCPPRPHARPG